MAYSYVNYTGNGSTTQFSVPMPYIRKEHIHVYVNNVEVSFTWVNTTTALLASAPANGAAVQVRRVTPILLPLVDYSDGSTFVAADLDTSNLQHLYNTQELDDSDKQAIYVDPATGQLTAGNQKIGNVGTPTVGADAATKAYVDTADAAVVAAVAANAASAATSATSANAALVAAEAARDQTLAAYDNFDDRFLGSKAGDPTLDNDGNALVGGALYFNTTAGQMRLWTGTAWVAAYVSGTASGIGFTPAGNVAATDVQSAIQELDTEKMPSTGGTFAGPVTHGYTSAETLPSGTTAQRPGMPVAGMVRYNSELVQYEGYKGGVWGPVGASVFYQEFTGNGTWTKPAGITTVYVECVSGGGGGGSGRRGATSTNRFGGAMGAGGYFASIRINAALVASTVSVTVGAGGTGGSAVTVNDTNGASGSAGGISSFGNYLWSPAASASTGGGTTSGSIGTYSAPWSSYVSLYGGISNQPVIYGPASGSLGQQIDATNTAITVGPAQNGFIAKKQTYTGAPAGAAGGNPGSNGATEGDGGGGGSSNPTGAGFAGGNGAFPGGGGGGGGASLNGFNSGAGGNGAAGVVRVWAW